MNIKELIKLVQEDVSNAKDMSSEDLVKILKKLSDAYYNTDDSIVDDKTYDYLRDLLEETDPDNEFLSVVGAPIKGTKKKVKLPYSMGGLTQLKANTDKIEDWTKKFKGPYIVSDKLDGSSAELYKDKDGNTFLFSRGDGVMGQDISHLITKFFTKKVIDKIPNDTCIRGEVIIRKDNFSKIEKFMKNARNATSGLINSKTVDERVAKVSEFVAYAILHPRYDHENQFKLLNEWGVSTAHNEKFKKIDTESLTKHLTERKKKSDFEIDGVVIADDSKIHDHVGDYPTYAFKFKLLFDDQIFETTVVKVDWNPSKNGYLKPRIEIDPIKVGGVTITYATAHNAKFISDNVIGKGAKVKITRSGDVIPYIVGVTKEATSRKPDMPTMKYEWTDTKVDIIATEMDSETAEIVNTKLITFFFRTMDVKYLSEGIVAKLVTEGYDSIIKILKVDKTKLYNISGLGKKVVDKIYDEINRAFDEVDLATFMGASHKFGRGMGTRKLREITDMYPDILTVKWSKEKMLEKILEVSGFSDKLAQVFVDNFADFKKFYKEVSEYVEIERFENIESESDSDEEEKIFDKKIIVFTGFRDKELEKTIVKLGGKVSGSVSGKTSFVVYADGGDPTSSKLEKAKDLGVTVMSKSEFIKKFKI